MRAPTLLSLLVSHWTVSASVIVAVVAVSAMYARAAWRLRDRWPARRTVSFLCGLGCVLVALQSGLDSYDDKLLSAHMAQHMLLLLVAPLLVLGGRPVILALRALPARPRARAASVLSRVRPVAGPVPALLLFSAVVVLTHLPSFYDATLRHPLLHELEHALYLAAGFVMWSPLIDADPAPAHRLSGLGRLVYLLVAMMPMVLIGAYLNRHAALFYSPYGALARALGISALGDQAQAGAIMWVVGGVIMTAAGLWAAMSAMVAEERRLVAREARLASSDRGSPA